MSHPLFSSIQTKGRADLLPSRRDTPEDAAKLTFINLESTRDRGGRDPGARRTRPHPASEADARRQLQEDLRTSCPPSPPPPCARAAPLWGTPLPPRAAPCATWWHRFSWKLLSHYSKYLWLFPTWNMGPYHAQEGGGECQQAR